MPAAGFVEAVCFRKQPSWNYELFGNFPACSFEAAGKRFTVNLAGPGVYWFKSLLSHLLFGSKPCTELVNLTPDDNANEPAAAPAFVSEKSKLTRGTPNAAVLAHAVYLPAAGGLSVFVDVVRGGLALVTASSGSSVLSLRPCFVVCALPGRTFVSLSPVFGPTTSSAHPRSVCRPLPLPLFRRLGIGGPAESLPASAPAPSAPVLAGRLLVMDCVPCVSAKPRTLGLSPNLPRLRWTLGATFLQLSTSPEPTWIRLPTLVRSRCLATARPRPRYPARRVLPPMLRRLCLLPAVVT